MIIELPQILFLDRKFKCHKDELDNTNEWNSQRQIRGNGEACGKVMSTYFKGVKIQLKGEKNTLLVKK